MLASLKALFVGVGGVGTNSWSTPLEDLWAETRLFIGHPQISLSLGLFSWDDQCYRRGVWTFLLTVAVGVGGVF